MLTPIKTNQINKFAFTLAEVLIVLGIIGIVAQMTLPTVYNNSRKAVAVASVSQSFSMLNQAIKLSEIDNGPVADWAYNSGSSSFAISHAFFDTYLKPYLISPTFCSEGYNNSCGSNVSSAGVNYKLNNGVGFSIVNHSTRASIIIDVNNGQLPNKMGLDVFYFEITPQNGLNPYGWVKGMAREQIISNGAVGNCTPDTTKPLQRHMCTALLMYDGWKMSNDYPWK